MRGVIGNWQAFTHLGLIWREFGPRYAARCVAAMLRGQGKITFLDIAFEVDRSARRRS